MDKHATIDKISTRFGLTSRTLRHWESEGLFQSYRDLPSGRRAYDDNALLAIQITALLRGFDIPIKEIKPVIALMTLESMAKAIAGHMDRIRATKSELRHQEEALENLYTLVQSRRQEQLLTSNLLSQFNPLAIDTQEHHSKEVVFMNESAAYPLQVKFITLPPMRFAYSVAVSCSPEEEALHTIVDWLTAEELLGTARLFGGNMPPHPSNEGKPYGYGVCASIPEHVILPDRLKEMRFGGGVYAAMESGDNINGSWQTLMNYLKKSPEYKADHKSRLCFEEHIRNDNPEGSGSQYLLNLLEPVRKR